MVSQHHQFGEGGGFLKLRAVTKCLWKETGTRIGEMGVIKIAHGGRKNVILLTPDELDGNTA